MAHPLVEKLDRTRLADDLWRMVNVHSPTCNEREMAFVYAEMLAEAGAEVRVDETLPNSPNVIGRLKGNRPGKTIQICGHMDHIDVEHAAPTRTDEIISGRGSGDMKGGLAGMLEVVRLLKQSGCDFSGEVLVTAYGLHEAPDGDSGGLRNMIADGVVGDAAIIFEGRNAINCQNVIAGKGQSIWNITIRREGQAWHELARPDNADDLLTACNCVITALEKEKSRLQAESEVHPLLGRESLFVGQVHYGDFYNRAPDRCTMQGTRRWNPAKTFDEIREEFSALVAGIKVPDGITVESDWIFVGESYTIDKDEPIVQAFQSACRTMLGKEADYVGILSVLDASRLVPLGGVPTAAVGLDGWRGHSDNEYVELEVMHICCKVALQTMLDYLEAGEQNGHE